MLQSLPCFNLKDFVITLCYRFFNFKKDFENGRTKAASARPEHQQRSEAFLSVKMWFEKFVKSMADKRPNECKKHLPSCLTKETVYRMLEEEMKKHRKDGKCLKYSSTTCGRPIFKML